MLAKRKRKKKSSVYYFHHGANSFSAYTEVHFKLEGKKGNLIFKESRSLIYSVHTDYYKTFKWEAK